MKRYLSVMVIVLSLLGMNCTKKGHMTRFLQSELEVKIHPVNIDEDISYSALTKRDKNGDGFVNQLDDGLKLKFKRWRDILTSYLIYLNRYQPYDARYRDYQDMDLNLNQNVERFEETLCNKRKRGKEQECFVILEQAKEDRNLTQYQLDRAKYSLSNYFGHYQKRYQTRRQIAKNYPDSPFKVIEDTDFHKLADNWFDYRFKIEEPRWLFSEYLEESILPRIHLYYDYMDLIIYEADEIFPYAFSDNVFMQKLISALLWNVEIAIVKESKGLRETKHEKDQENQRQKIKWMKDKFDQLDLIYSYLSKVHQKSDFISDRVAVHQSRLRRHEKETKTVKVLNFEQALKLVQTYIDSNLDIRRNDFHLVVSALLKNHIENKKSFDDGNILFSPDMLFEKGNGVCGDQSPALALMLKELTGGELDARLYYWKRKYYYGHMSMIYRNLDGFYYIMDNQGIQAFRYSSLDEAIRSNAPYAYEYRESISMNGSPGENKEWSNVIYKNQDTITSPDDKLTITFGESRMIK